MVSYLKTFIAKIVNVYKENITEIGQRSDKNNFKSYDLYKP